MTKQLTVLLICLLPFALKAQETPKDVKQFVSELDQKIPELLNDFIVPGTAIAIIENGKVVLQKGYGYADVEKGIKVSNQTGFNIGSISKTVAAWGVLKLVEEGKIDLDAPVEKYLTRWHLPESEFDANKVTIRRLLSHTAGLSLHGYPGWTPSDELPTIEESLNGKNNGPGRVEMIMEPGTQWKYSGGGFSILQLIVEEVTGEKFENYMQTQILNPLGMTNSSYTIDKKIMKASSLEHSPFGEEIDFELFTAQAAAGLHTTIEDFVIFAQASLYANKGHKKYEHVLTSRTIEGMMVPAPASDGRYGLGYQVDSIYGTSMVLRGHGGANSGWHAFLRVDPVTNDGFIMVTNGGAGHNIYRQVFCDWISWKTGETTGSRCNIKSPIAAKLKNIIDSKGIDGIEAKYADLKKNKGEKYDFSERQLNELGYYYLGKDKIETALAVFKINMEAFPTAFNVFDSYGEALLKNGDKEGAIENYKKSVELNPGNDGGIQVLNSLGVNTDDLAKEVIIEDKVLESYLGKYEMEPGFILTVSKEGKQMKVHATGQGEFPLFPKSENAFYLKVADIQLIFNRNAEGKVESLTSIQGGQETIAPKIDK
jgi:CubicO group peptidase (beta-lactamase class C family)